MATHSSIVAWEIPWTEEPGGLQSMELHSPKRIHTHTHTHTHIHTTGFLGASAVKNPPAMQKMWVQSLGQNDPLEKEMPTHSSIFAWKIPWTVKLGRLQSTE